MSYLVSVALFIRKNPLNIKTTIIEKLLLYTLAGRIGQNEKTWISQEVLANEMQVSERHMRRAITKLSKLGIILIKKVWRHNHYFLDKNMLLTGHPCPMKDEVSPDTQVRLEPSSPDTRVQITGLPSPMIEQKNELQVIETKKEKTTDDAPESNKESNNKRIKKQSLVRFDEFWSEYPRKISKKSAIRKWTTLKCDKFADEIIRNVKARNAEEWKGKEMQFIPHPTTFLNQERWKDEPEIINHATHQRPNGHTRAQTSVLNHLAFLDKIGQTH